MPRRPHYVIEPIRALAKERVGQSTVRVVAAEIGMSPSGLHSFLKGTEPYAPVRKKLDEWYRTYSARGVATPTPGEAGTAFRILAAYLHHGGVLRVSEAEVNGVVSKLLDGAGTATGDRDGEP